MKIRLLPMSKVEFKTEEDVMKFLLERLCKEDGKYYYRRKSIIYKEDVIVAFQYGGKIIGSSIMVDQLSEHIIENDVEYTGCFVFDTNSFIACCEPITSSTIKKIMPEFKGFNQSTQYLSEECIKIIR